MSISHQPAKGSVWDQMTPDWRRQLLADLMRMHEDKETVATFKKSNDDGAEEEINRDVPIVRRKTSAPAPAIHSETAAEWSDQADALDEPTREPPEDRQSGWENLPKVFNAGNIGKATKVEDD